MTKRHEVILKKDDFYDDDSMNSSLTIRTVRYRECQKNHAASVGGYAVNGCREFMHVARKELPAPFLVQPVAVTIISIEGKWKLKLPQTIPSLLKSKFFALMV
ncbi:hypothetical protein RND71_014483 [Anisodus tanguticus]|uniref:ZF-HD dimerization-type domain-containing protein n=1 Tax=Anisodus tanguticus TaxID=243964 RepID=A0AAE1SBY9_9SOLA|nr:hypothetical protein RND71_014483 [Anisodus tanguticus]